MIILNINNSYNYELEKLCRIFLPYERITVTDNSEQFDGKTELKMEETETLLSASLNLYGQGAEFEDTVPNDDPDYDKECERVLALQLYKCFTKITGYISEWGILTGIRPAKLYSHFVRETSKKEATEIFRTKFAVSEEKVSLCEETEKGERKIIELSGKKSFSLYVSIPFCPTRCSYCSFVSHSVEKSHALIPQYLDKLIDELSYTSKLIEKYDLKLETIYIGGGTPTTLTAEQMDRLMKAINTYFKTDDILEYTVEAGRPDTITQEKLEVIKKNGATRVSINPQTMSDEILKKIGRKHTVAQTVEAFNLARQIGFSNINMDLIAGLPDDTPQNFKKTVDAVIALQPDSVTVHSLSLKRAATLNRVGELPEFEDGKKAAEMVRYARKTLTENGILPYYMYRQSKTLGNLENVGYAKRGKEGFYNVYIMDETHTILACGASAVTKLRDIDSTYIKRIFNYKYPYEYVNNFEEIISRKESITEFYDKYCICNK